MSNCLSRWQSTLLALLLPVYSVAWCVIGNGDDNGTWLFSTLEQVLSALLIGDQVAWCTTSQMEKKDAKKTFSILKQLRSRLLVV